MGLPGVLGTCPNCCLACNFAAVLPSEIFLKLAGISPCACVITGFGSMSVTDITSLTGSISMKGGAGMGDSFSWIGATGPVTVEKYTTADCSGSSETVTVPTLNVVMQIFPVSGGDAPCTLAIEINDPVTVGGVYFSYSGVVTRATLFDILNGHMGCGSGFVAEGGTAQISLTALLRRLIQQPECRHRGKEIRRVKCKSCGGNVKAVVKKCKIHKECTQFSKPVNGVKSCNGCSDFKPRQSRR